MTVLTAERVQNIASLCPTAEEVQALSQHDVTDGPASVPKLDGFMLQLNSVPRVQQRLR